jgi:hypothetical protein
VVSNQNNDHLSIACAVALEQATGGWIPPWRSWLAELPETVVSAQPVKELTKAVKKTATRKKAKLD